MLTFDYVSPYFWGKVVLTKFISGCHMVWDLICGTSWSYKSRTEKVRAGRKSAILPNWCCLLFITVLSGYPWNFRIYFPFFWWNSFRASKMFIGHEWLMIQNWRVKWASDRAKTCSTSKIGISLFKLFKFNILDILKESDKNNTN